MTKHHKKIDFRPFKSKADHQREQELQDQYRRVAIPEVIAALKPRTTRRAELPATD